MPDVQRIYDYRGIVGLARLDECNRVGLMANPMLSRMEKRYGC